MLLAENAQKLYRDFIGSFFDFWIRASLSPSPTAKIPITLSEGEL